MIGWMKIYIFHFYGIGGKILESEVKKNGSVCCIIDIMYYYCIVLFQ